MKHFPPAIRYLLWVAPLALGSSASTAAQNDDLDARWREIGVLREDLPGNENPVLKLDQLLADVPAELRSIFSDGSQARPFNRYQPNEHVVKQCRALQNDARRIIARGPGQHIFVKDQFPEMNGFLLWRANAALATQSFNESSFRRSAAHLAFNFQVADFQLRSEPSLMRMIGSEGARKRVYEDLFTLYQANPSKAQLDQFSRIHQRHRLKRSDLHFILRGEARQSLLYFEDYRAGIQKFFDTGAQSGAQRPFDNYEKPLRNCTRKDLEPMKYDLNAARARFLQKCEAHAKWIASNDPVSQHPFFSKKRKPPLSLKHYQDAPNGLYDIFEDCWHFDPFLSSCLDLLTHDVLMETAIAWLRAEADGVDVNSLSTLVPTYLPTIPLDPADGNPLRCHPKKRTIYSVDFDLNDDGGEPLPELGPDFKLPESSDTIFVVPEIRQ